MFPQLYIIYQKKGFYRHFRNFSSKQFLFSSYIPFYLLSLHHYFIPGITPPKRPFEYSSASDPNRVIFNSLPVKKNLVFDLANDAVSSISKAPSTVQGTLDGFSYLRFRGGRRRMVSFILAHNNSRIYILHTINTNTGSPRERGQKSTSLMGAKYHDFGNDENLSRCGEIFGTGLSFIVQEFSVRHLNYRPRGILACFRFPRRLPSPLLTPTLPLLPILRAPSSRLSRASPRRRPPKFQANHSCHVAGC